jgi:hypothetical protein
MRGLESEVSPKEYDVKNFSRTFLLYNSEMDGMYTS